MKGMLFHILLIIISFQTYSQSAVGLKVNSIAYHPFNWNQDASMFENKLTPSGSFIMEPGLELYYQKYFYLTNWSIDPKFSIFSDAAAKMAGYAGLSLSWKFFHYKRSAIQVSVGPVFAFRENWNKIWQYVDNDNFTNGTKYQYKGLLAVDLSYYHYIGKRSDLSISLAFNNSQNAISFALGYRQWINPYVNLKQKSCDNCGKRWNRGAFRKWWRKVWR